jgi:hypothetical protein
MSAPISSATSSTMGLAESLVSSRPLLQSRRVSFKLGPLGITYFSDQVLWSAATGTAAADTKTPAARILPESAAAGAADFNAQDAADARQAETAQTEAQQTARSFSQEMLAAWRSERGKRQSDSAVYGPNGVLRGVRAAAQDRGGSQDSADESQETEQLSGRQTGQQADQNANQPPQRVAQASRIRQAIAAYIACARNDGASRPMLSAVA